MSAISMRGGAPTAASTAPRPTTAATGIVNTWWGLAALDVLGRSQENRDATIAWLRACQLPGGGFTYQPEAEIGGWDDVAYTWAAVRSLTLLGAAPADRAACVKYLHSLWNADGGFGDQTGWASNPRGDLLRTGRAGALGALDLRASPPENAGPAGRRCPAACAVWSIQIEAHGQGSPAEAVDLAQSLKIHLWGAKNATAALAREGTSARRRAKGVPVRFFVANEEYGTWVSVPGLGTYSHTSDIIAPANADFGPSLANKGVAIWEEFRERRLAPLARPAGGCLAIWRERAAGADATRRFAAARRLCGDQHVPFRQPGLHQQRAVSEALPGADPVRRAAGRARRRAVVVRRQTTGFRTLFLATEPTWDGWLAALKHNWVVAVRHDAVSGGQTWMHGGLDRVIDFVRANASSGSGGTTPKSNARSCRSSRYPLPDEFEVARPTAGVAIRVRCAWENTSSGPAEDAAR